MPEAALAEGKALLDGLVPGASDYRKVGVCLVLEASALPDAGPLIEGFTDDAETYVRGEARWCLERFRERTGEQEKE